eukprot:scpid94442/ scgid10737/ 
MECSRLVCILICLGLSDQAVSGSTAPVEANVSTMLQPCHCAHTTRHGAPQALQANDLENCTKGELNATTNCTSRRVYHYPQVIDSQKITAWTTTFNAFCNNGYTILYRKARDASPWCDDVINIFPTLLVYWFKAPCQVAICARNSDYCSSFNVTNGQFNVSNTQINGTGSVTCNPGYRSSKDAPMECNEYNATHGVWTNTQSCDPIPGYCSSVINVKNGLVHVNGTRIGAEANGTCNQGYQPLNSSAMTCQPRNDTHGVWNNQLNCKAFAGYCTS